MRRLLAICLVVACGSPAEDDRCASPAECELGERCVNGFCIPGEDAGNDATVDAARDTALDAPAVDAPGEDAPTADVPVDTVDAGPHEPTYLVIDIPFSTTEAPSIEPIPGASLSIPDDGRDWVLLASAKITTGSTSRSGAEIDLRIDGSNRSRGWCRVMETPECAWQAFDFLSAGAHDLVVRAEGAAGLPTEVHDLRVVAFPLPMGTVVEYDDSNAQRALDGASASWDTAAQLDLDPGSYVVLATGAVERDMNGIGAELRVDDSLEGTWPPASSMGSWVFYNSRVSGWRSALFTRVLEDTPARRLRIQTSKAGGTGQILVAHTRLLAIPTSAFAAIAHVLEADPVDNVSTTSIVAAGLTTPSASIRDQIVIMGSVVTFRSDALELSMEIAGETVDFTPTNPDDDDERLSYARVAALSSGGATSHEMRWRLAPPTIGTVAEIKEASIVVLDLFPADP